MTRKFVSADEYYSAPQVVATARNLGGILATELLEAPNDIVMSTTLQHSLLLSLSGSDNHAMSFGDCRRSGATHRGDLALIPAGVELRSRWDTQGYRLNTFALEFPTDLFKHLVPEICSPAFLSGHLVSRSYAPQAELSSLALMFRCELVEGVNRGALFHQSLLRVLLLEVAASYWTSPAALPCDGLRRDSRVKRAIDYIHAHYLEDISLVDIASAAGISPTALTRRFRQETTLNPYAFVIELRLQHATVMLKTTDMPLARVAGAAGFADQQHMTRVFSAKRGITPGAIRRGG